MNDLRLLVSGSSPPTVIALTETWLDDRESDCEVSLPSYSLFRKDRGRKGGGVAVYVLDSITVRSVSCSSLSELLSVKLVTKSGILLIAVLYRPPGVDIDPLS